jgi:hypothetical protein
MGVHVVGKQGLRAVDWRTLGLGPVLALVLLPGLLPSSPAVAAGRGCGRLALLTPVLTAAHYTRNATTALVGISRNNNPEKGGRLIEPAQRKKISRRSRHCGGGI